MKILYLVLACLRYLDNQAQDTFGTCVLFYSVIGTWSLMFHCFTALVTGTTLFLRFNGHVLRPAFN
jgi:hypothetical protein